MATEKPGAVLVEAASRARGGVFLCAPFVKAQALERVLAAVDEEVEAIELFTRWRPEEIAAGVSDTSVLPMVDARGGSVFLCDRLHAKLFRFVDRVLTGSANLTGAALGWVGAPNLEILMEIPARSTEVVALESLLRRESVTATASIAATVELAAERLPAGWVAHDPAPDAPPAPAGFWHPLLREPRDLFVAYSQGSDQLSRASGRAAVLDLRALEIPPSLGRDAFERLVGTRLLQTPIVQTVDEALSSPQRFGAIRGLLGEQLGVDRHDAEQAWQALMRWMLYFLPDRYQRKVFRHSEVIARRQVHVQDRPS